MNIQEEKRGNEMETWFASDTHWGHANIIDFCQRPYGSVEEMNVAMAENWNNTVGAEDTVWFLGDFAMGKIRETLPWAGQLNGYKILLPGNHDRCWVGHTEKKRLGWREEYLAAGFDEVLEVNELDIELDGRVVTLCHFPHSGDSHGEDRYTGFRPARTGKWLIHGHVHDKWQIDRPNKQINVGIDVWGYRPVSATRLSEIING
jgi:calcineurin-like phosphoesterase family protein